MKVTIYVSGERGNQGWWWNVGCRLKVGSATRSKTRTVRQLTGGHRWWVTSL